MVIVVVVMFIAKEMAVIGSFVLIETVLEAVVAVAVAVVVAVNIEIMVVKKVMV